MKKLFIIVVLLAISVAAFAQKASEIVYLKNGSIIKGAVIEQNISDQTIKLRTADGSIFVYALNEVEKIEKIEKIENKNVVQHNDEEDDDEDDEKDSVGKFPTKGYRGFGGLSQHFGLGDYNEIDKIAFNTTHGMQLNSLLYLGGGLQFQYYTDIEVVSLTPYLNANFNILRKKCSPIVDLKIGQTYFINEDDNGFYDAFSIGIRVNRCNFMLGIDQQVFNVSYKEYDTDYYVEKSSKEVMSSFFLSFSMDFGRRR